MDPLGINGSFVCSLKNRGCLVYRNARPSICHCNPNVEKREIALMKNLRDKTVHRRFMT